MSNYFGFVDGSTTQLIDRVTTAVLDAMQGHTPVTDVFRFDAYTPNSAYARNGRFWVSAYDFSGLSVWNTAVGGATGNAHAGTAVTRKHVLQANHFVCGIGDTLGFVAADGTYVTRTIAAVTQVGSTDIEIVTLDSDLPVNVKVYPVFSGNFVGQFKGLIAAQDQSIRVCRAELIDVSGSKDFCQVIGEPEYPAWSHTPQSGDSGQPVFFPVDGNLVLVCIQHLTTGGDNLARYLTEIGSIITPYTLQLVAAS